MVAESDEGSKAKRMIEFAPVVGTLFPATASDSSTMVPKQGSSCRWWSKGESNPDRQVTIRRPFQASNPVLF